MIIGELGSFAEEYAMNNSINFRATQENYVTLDVDASTNKAVINVSGSAPAGRTVKIYDGNTLLDTFTVNKARRYGGNVTLVGGYGSHTIRAETTDGDGKTVSASTMVTYEENAPRLVDFIMHHDGQTINLMTTDGIRQMLIFRGGRSFTFEIKTENSNQINEMYVVSERSGVEKRMRAIYNASKDLWIASGFFDPNDTNYVPGRLSVSISGNTPLIDPQDIAFDFNAPLNFDELEWIPEWENAENKIIENTDSKIIIETILDDADKTTFTSTLTTEIVSDKNITAQSLQNQGFTEFTDVNGQTFYTKMTAVGSNNTSPRTEIYIKPKDYKGPLGPIDDAIDWIKSIYDISGNVNDAYKFAKHGVLPKVGPSSIASFAFDTALDGYRSYHYAKDCINTGAKIMEGTTFAVNTALNLGATIAMPGLIAMGPIGWVGAGVLTAGMIYAKNLITEAGREAVPCQTMGANNGGHQIAIIIDPAGYIYEAVPSNRLQGVKTTAYYKGENDEAVLWDASEYDQANPLVTDREGRYAWYVPEGLWQVKAELSGYETSYSEWVEVPPPQTEVNLGMVSLVAPTVKNAIGYASGIEIIFSKYMSISSLNTSNISVTQNGNAVSGTIEFINKEADSIKDGQEYASTIKFVPDTDFTSANVTLIVKNVQSYAGIGMSADITREITIQLEPKSIIANNISFKYGESGNITVTVLPAEASADKKVIAVSSDTLIANVVGEVTLDATGNAVIPVTAELPGMIDVTLTLAGTNLQTQAEVNITMLEQAPKISNPIVSVPSGSVEIGTTVELSSAVEGATIYYTTDGSCPRSSSTKEIYTTPITILKDVTLSAVVYKDGYSDVMIFIYTVKSAKTIVLELGITDESKNNGYGIENNALIVLVA